MIGVLVVIFLNFPVGSMLNATNNQRINTINMAIIVLVNILLNLLLIDRYAHVGSAIAASCSLVLLFILGLTRVNNLVEYNGRFLVKTFLFTVGISLVASVVVWFMKQFTSIFFTAPVFIIIYCVGVFLFKIVTKNDVRFALGAVIKRRSI
jgi:O-antigen/teichoic acid export membrane protein